MKGRVPPDRSAWPKWAVSTTLNPIRITDLMSALFDFFGWDYPGVSLNDCATNQATDAAALKNRGFNFNPEVWAHLKTAQPVELSAKKRLCLVVIDGMGFHQLQARRGHLPFLRPRLLQATEALGSQPQTCVPATTVAALTSLHTGKTPGETGMLGYECWNPATGRNLNLITFQSGPIVKCPWTAFPINTAWPNQTDSRIAAPEDSQGSAEWSSQDTFFTYANRLGLRTVALVPPKFIGSQLSSITLKDATCQPLKTFPQRIRAAVKEFRGGADYVYLYSSDLDHVGHHQGWKSSQWTAQLEEIDRDLAVLAASLPADVLLVVTADHGMVDTSLEATLDLRNLELAEQIQNIAGEPRALHIHLKEDCLEPIGDDGSSFQLSRVHTSANASLLYPGNRRVKPQIRQQWQQVLGEEYLVTDRYWDFYGWVKDPDRLGDLTVFAAKNRQLIDSRFQSVGVQSLVGVHGSLTAEEMEIPLILA